MGKTPAEGAWGDSFPCLRCGTEAQGRPHPKMEDATLYTCASCGYQFRDGDAAAAPKKK